jgi:YidC/Oxa1 family membrane protein insertase
MKNGKARLVLLVLALGAITMSSYALDERPAGAAQRESRTSVPSRDAVDAHGRGTPLDAPALKGELVTLETDDFIATFDTRNLGLTSYRLKDPRYQLHEQQIDLVTTDRPTFRPFSVQVDGADVPGDVVWEAERISDAAARFTLRTDKLTIVRKLEVGRGPFQLWSTVRVHNHGQSALDVSVRVAGYHYVKRADEGGGMLGGRSPLMAGAMCTRTGEPERFDRPDVVEDKPRFEKDVVFGALDNVYFTQAYAADGASFESCTLGGDDRGGTVEDPEGSLLTLSLSYPKQKLAQGAAQTFRTIAYLGPKSPDLLAQAGHGLTAASFVGGLPGIDAIAQGLVAMLAAIHGFVGNWGLAIILLTLAVKLVLYPLTAKSFESMAAMRKLKPEIDALNERFADDREKKGAAMMELYRKHKINPLGGCLPQLLQLPIWWALYMSLSSNVELFRRPFFGFWSDLAAPDPYYVLPLALGVLMWVQQKITPSTMDPAQAKMMLYMMPTMITAFMLFLPSGLCLYMFTNSVLSIGQQRFIEYRLATSEPGSPSGGEPTSESSASPGRTGRGRA